MNLKVVGLLTTAVLGLGVLIFVAPTEDRAMAQSGTRTPAGTQTYPRSQMANQTFEQKFWDYLSKAQYQNWAPVPGHSDDFQEGQSPHGKWVKLYLNRTAAGNPQNPPHGSVVVKENYGPDKKSLMAVTVMYRSKGFNPDAGDWYWVKYNTDGTVAKTPPEMGSMPIAGRAKGCIDCHSGSNGNDYAFFNDSLANE